MAAMGAASVITDDRGERPVWVEPGGSVAIPRMAAIRRMRDISAIHDRFAKPLA